jgi:small subunit ribosomal protein S15
MYLTSEAKKQIFREHGGAETATGTTESQVALFTVRINFLTKHLKENPKDLGTKRSLVNLVGKRKALLEYLKAKDIARYRALIKKLDIRR